MSRTPAGATLAARLAATAVGQEEGAKPPEKKPAPVNPFAELPKLDATANYLGRVAKLRALRAFGRGRENVDEENCEA